MKQKICDFCGTIEKDGDVLYKAMANNTMFTISVGEIASWDACRTCKTKIIELINKQKGGLK